MPLGIRILNTLIALVREFGPMLAIGAGIYWAYLLYRRIFVSASDPSVRRFNSSAIGSMSFLVSGAYASAAIAGSIALLTWPAVIETPAIGYALVGGVVVHAAFEYREAQQEGT
jgi:hypothetical protein